MNGSAIRTGEYVRPASERRAERRSFLVLVLGPDEVMVEDSFALRLGFSHEQARNAKRQFSHTLKEVTLRVVDQQTRDLGRVSPALAGPAEGDPLRLDPQTSLEYLHVLRRLGAGLRGRFSQELVEQLKECGLPAEGDSEESALNFLETQAPILWEMCYEGRQTDPLDWRRFWGFRVPITHWMTGQPRTAEDIFLRHGLFTAISEDLAFTGHEVEALARHIDQQTAGLRYGSLAEALHERVCRERAGSVVGDDRAGLLGRHLGSKPLPERSAWKDRALIDIFTTARLDYNLIHFACHCEANEETELLTCLVMHVSGEPFHLDVSLLTSDLQLRPEDRARWRSGILVFLNACGSTHQNRSAEPPGFPDSWIKYGASAVIATLCPVPDAFAHAFAVKFYEFLLAGPGLQPDTTEGGGRYRYLAEALLATRRHFMQEHNNPLGLAYVLYARKGVRVLPARGDEEVRCAHG